ncbi:MAG: glycoside hydrolase family 130 protein [Candidatus Brocadiia bacterium]
MHRKLARNLVQRYEQNPVLSMRELPFPASDVHNAGAVRHEGEYILLVTVEELDGRCAVYRATSPDGRSFQMGEEPVLAPSREDHYAPYEEDGVRDARVTRFDDRYYVTYLAHSKYGFRLGLAETSDFTSIERIGLMSEPDTKNGVLFPQKVDGRFARLERPREGGNIWISYSDDLTYWGGMEVVMTSRHGYWDHDRIGAAVPPIETPCGWLLFYYGVKNNPGGPLFRLGAAFLDPENPSTVIGRTNIPLLAPRERYERIGDVGNLIFSCGGVLSEDGSEVEIYYGAADSCVCLGTMSMQSLKPLCDLG